MLIEISDSIWINPESVMSVCVAGSKDKICIKTTEEEFLIPAEYGLTIYQTLDIIVNSINEESK